MSNSQPAYPPAMWAQTYDSIYLTYNVECKNPTVTIEEDSVNFEGLCLPDNVVFQGKIKLYAKVLPDKSSQINKGRNVELVLRKKDSECAFWPRLTLENAKQHWLRVDFSKFEESDSSDEKAPDNSFEDIMNQFGNNDAEKPQFDDTETDSDDDALPDLEG